MSLETAVETIINDLKENFHQLVQLLKGQAAMSGTEPDESAIHAHAVNILKNHAQGLESTASTNGSQSVSQSASAEPAQPEPTPTTEGAQEHGEPTNTAS